MRRNYRTPTEAEQKKLDEARAVVQRGIESENSFLTKLMPTERADAKREIRRGMKLRESVDPRAREGEAYNQAGYAKGGEVDEELREYRKQRGYTGYEDYTPSGRVALRAYNEASKTARDWGKPPRGSVYSPSAASEAQRAQREYANEIQRETRGKAGSADSGKYAKGGKIDGCAQRGKTKGRVI